jgi:hypothetical protein
MDKPPVFVFPQLLICLDCGAAQFAVSPRELRLLSAKADVAAWGRAFLAHYQIWSAPWAEKESIEFFTQHSAPFAKREDGMKVQHYETAPEQIVADARSTDLRLGCQAEGFGIFNFKPETPGGIACEDWPNPAYSLWTAACSSIDNSKTSS